MADKKIVTVHQTVYDDDEVEEDDTELKTRKYRKMNSKGLEYAQGRKRKRLEQLCRGMEKSSDRVMELMDTGADQYAVQTEYKQWIGLFDEFLSVDDDYRNLLSPDEITEYDENWYYARFHAFSEFRTTAQQWLTRKAKEDAPRKHDVDPDKISVISVGHSHKTSSSRKSSRTVVSARMQHEQKRAELEIKMDSLKKRIQLEEEKLHLQLQEEELNLIEELAISDTHCKFLDVDCESQKKHSSRASSVGNDSTALMAVVRHLNKPTSEIKKFSGNPVEFHRFMRQFETRVVVNCDTYDEKYNFLECYTLGDAHKVVSGFVQIRDSRKAYTTAMQALHERYGDSDVVVNAYMPIYRKR